MGCCWLSSCCYVSCVIDVSDSPLVSLQSSVASSPTEWASRSPPSEAICSALYVSFFSLVFYVYTRKLCMREILIITFIVNFTEEERGGAGGRRQSG